MEKDEIRDSFTRHDRYEFEMVFRYPRPREKGGAEEYHADVYFFLPPSLGINRETYPAEMFYRDMRRYIRLRTPSVELRAIPDGPLLRLKMAIIRFADDPSESNSKEFVDRTKLFCSILKSALRDGSRELMQKKGDGDFRKIFLDTQSAIDRIKQEFRNLRPLLDVSRVSPRDLEWFGFADEFVSLLTNKWRCRQYEDLGSAPEFEDIRRFLHDRIADEIGYRRECGYPSVPDPADGNELLLYREGVLKKIMASVLFLRVCRQRDGVLAENLVFGLAAAIAMTFVTAVSFVWHGLFLEPFSLAFFSIWVLAYVGKDRIKDLLKLYFKNHLKRYFYDYRTRLHNALGHPVGCCREGVSFVPENRVPEKVLTLRGRSFLGCLENAESAEEILHMRELLTVRPEKNKFVLPDTDVTGIVDIMRFNLRHFMEHMDNPEKEILLPSGGHLRSRTARRVYHVNVVVHYAMDEAPDVYRHFRMILARDGIRRIEAVPNPDGGILRRDPVF